jgi:O-antigen/teichoic acid export membrane protein
MIGFLIDAKTVGIYNAAVPISLFLTLTSEFFTKLFFPMVTKEYFESEKNIPLVKQLSKQVGKWIFLFNLPFFLLGLLFPEFVINLLFGEQYLYAALPLQILLFGTFFASVSTVSLKLISMKGKSKLILINTLGIFLMNIILNFFLIPKFGLTGAAISTTLSLILLNFLFLLQANKYLSIIPIKRKMLKIALISLIPLSITFFLKNKFALSTFLDYALLITFFILLYILLIFSTSCLDKNDMMILKSIKDKIRDR